MNNAHLLSNENDKRRLFCSTNTVTLRETGYDILKIMSKFGLHMPSVVYAKPVLVKQLPLCKPQIGHTDYMKDSKAFSRHRDFNAGVPIGMLLALTNRSIRVTPRSHRDANVPEVVVNMVPGDIIVIRGDLLHRGDRSQGSHTYAVHYYGDCSDGCLGAVHADNAVHTS